jgi:hypothetical protein
VAVLNDKARVLAGKLQRRFQRAARKLGSVRGILR